MQKYFQATPVFTSLKVNPQLALATPFWHSVTILEKTDSTLAAITHGLLQQRQAFISACENLPLEVKKHLNDVVLEKGTEFRDTSDRLLQYTCGKRAEIIQQRRELYKASNKVINEILHDIPPSDTHLFSEEKLAEVVKDQGGPQKMFPPKFKKVYKKKPTSSTPKNYKRPFKTRDYKQDKQRFQKSRDQKFHQNKGKQRETKKY